MRIAAASPAQVISSNGTAWTYWNLTPEVFGEPTGTGFDYPDLAVGPNSLFMSWDAGVVASTVAVIPVSCRVTALFMIAIVIVPFIALLVPPVFFAVAFAAVFVALVMIALSRHEPSG
jgi:hypothetical protein